MGKGTANRGISNNGIPQNAQNFQSTVETQENKVLVEVDITGHASPRWEGAKTPQEASMKNLILSQKRASAIKFLIDQYFHEELKDYDISFSYDENFIPDVKHARTTHAMTSAGYGSQVTLDEANGDLTANDEVYRRVDIMINLSSYLQQKIITRNKRKQGYYLGSKKWGITFGIAKDLDLEKRVAGLKFLFFKIRNLNPEALKRERYSQGVIILFSIGGKLSVTDVVSFGSARRLMKLNSNLRKLKRAKSALQKSLQLQKINNVMNFFNFKLSFGKEIVLNTNKAHTMEEFDNVTVTGSGASASVLNIGVESDYLTLVGLGSIRENQENVSFNVGGLVFGTAPIIDAVGELGGRVGKMVFLNSTRDYFIKEKISSISQISEFKNSSDQRISIFFNTGSSTVSGIQKKQLKIFISQIASAYKIHMDTF